MCVNLTWINRQWKGWRKTILTRWLRLNFNVISTSLIKSYFSYICVNLTWIDWQWKCWIKLSKPDGYTIYIRHAIGLAITATTTEMHFSEHEHMNWEETVVRLYQGIGQELVTEWPFASDQVVWWRGSGEVWEERDLAVWICVTVFESDADTIHLHSLNFLVGSIGYRKEPEVQIRVTENVPVDRIFITVIFVQAQF